MVTVDEVVGAGVCGSDPEGTAGENADLGGEKSHLEVMPGVGGGNRVQDGKGWNRWRGR